MTESTDYEALKREHVEAVRRGQAERLGSQKRPLEQVRKDTFKEGRINPGPDDFDSGS